MRNASIVTVPRMAHFVRDGLALAPLGHLGVHQDHSPWKQEAGVPSQRKELNLKSLPLGLANDLLQLSSNVSHGFFFERRVWLFRLCC